MTGFKPLSMPVAVVGYMYGFVLQTASKINFSPHLSMVGELRKFTGHKYFLLALNHSFICLFIYSFICSFVIIQLFYYKLCSFLFYMLYCLLVTQQKSQVYHKKKLD